MYLTGFEDTKKDTDHVPDYLTKTWCDCQRFASKMVIVVQYYDDPLPLCGYSN